MHGRRHELKSCNVLVGWCSVITVITGQGGGAPDKEGQQCRDKQTDVSHFLSDPIFMVYFNDLFDILSVMCLILE